MWLTLKIETVYHKQAKKKGLVTVKRLKKIKLMEEEA